MKTSRGQHHRGCLATALLLVCSLSFLLCPASVSALQFCTHGVVKPEPPRSLTAIALGNRTYEVSWRSEDPARHNVEVFSLGWCTADVNLPHACNDENTNGVQYSLGDTTVTNIELPDLGEKNVEFSIFAISCFRGSEKVWASCIAHRNSSTVGGSTVVSAMDNVSVNAVGPDSITLRWTLDCSDRVDFVLGFEVSYCPIARLPPTLEVWRLTGPQRMDQLWQTFGHEQFQCKTPPKFATVTGEQERQAMIAGLQPNTSYKLAVRVLSVGGGRGAFSLPLFNTTLAAEPNDQLNKGASTSGSASNARSAPKRSGENTAYSAASPTFAEPEDKKINVSEETAVTLASFVPFFQRLTAATERMSESSAESAAAAVESAAAVREVVAAAQATAAAAERTAAAAEKRAEAAERRAEAAERRAAAAEARRARSSPK